jgi:hypothetical protein
VRSVVAGETKTWLNLVGRAEREGEGRIDTTLMK